MASIIRTIDSNHTIRVGDYVKFHNDKVGYVQSLVNTDSVRIRESGTSTRPRHYMVYKRNCTVIPIAFADQSTNRAILQPPSPKRNETEIVIENSSEDTKKLIAVLQKSRTWIYGSSQGSHPFLEYLEQNKTLEYGWIRKYLPEDINILKSN